jgi:hypothetical protein
MRYQRWSKDRDVHSANVTTQYVPLPTTDNESIAPTVRPSELKTKPFNLDDALTRKTTRNAPGERLELST